MVLAAEVLSILRSCRCQTLVVSFLGYKEEDYGQGGSLVEPAAHGPRLAGSFSCNLQLLSVRGSENLRADRDRERYFRVLQLFRLVQLPIFHHRLLELSASRVCQLLSLPSNVQRIPTGRRNHLATCPSYAGR